MALTINAISINRVNSFIAKYKLTSRNAMHFINDKWCLMFLCIISYISISVNYPKHPMYKDGESKYRHHSSSVGSNAIG